MAALGKVLLELQCVRDRITAARNYLRGAIESLTKARETYAAVLASSTHPDAEQTGTLAAKACTQITDQATGLDLADRLLRDLPLHHHRRPSSRRVDRTSADRPAPRN